MRLKELEAHFLKRDDSHHFHIVDTIAEADGVQFLCPVCFSKNSGSVGTHSVICWKPSVPQDTSPTPGRWNLVGAGIDDLSLIARSSSVKLESGCKAHFHVKNGAIS